MFLKKIQIYLDNKVNARDIVTLTVGSFLAQFLLLAATPILARIFDPAEFGAWVVFVAVSSVLSVVMTGKYESSMLLPKERRYAVALLLLCFCVIIFGALFLIVLIFLLPESVSSFYDLNKGYLLFIILFSALLASSAVIQAFLHREKKYLNIAVMRILQSFFFIVLALIFGVFSELEDSLILAQVLGLVFLIPVSIVFFIPKFKPSRFKEISEVAGLFKNSPRYTLPTSILDILTLQAPVLLIAYFFGKADSGQFGMAWRVLMLPISIIGAAIGQIFIQRFTFISEDKVSARLLLSETWIKLFLLSVPPLIGLYFFAETIFDFLLGAQWGVAAEITRILTPMALIMFVSSSTSGTFIALGMQKQGLRFSLVALLFRPSFIFISWLKGDLYFGLRLWVVFEMLLLFSYQFMVWRRLR